jgi:hypothetical protein
MEVKWQKKVLESEAPITIAKVARGGGKTFVAMQWARSRIGERVAFISKSRIKSEMAARVMASIYAEEIMQLTRNRLIFIDGTTITFGETKTEYNAMIMDSFVVDDANDLTVEKWNEIISRVRGKILVVGTKLSSPVERILYNRQGTVNYVVADYNDLLYDNLYSHELVEEINKMYFYVAKKEYGPWDKPKDLNNEDYLCLLHA